jgi:excisionase family DNA binding protein
VPSNDLLAAPRPTIAKPADIAPLAVGLVDAAKLLSVSPRHLQKLAATGVVPSVMIGGRRTFRVASLDAWLRRQEVATGKQR